MALGLGACCCAPASGQSQVSCLAVNPDTASEIWTCNRDNNTVAVVDVRAGTLVGEIAVAMQPRSIAFNQQGTRAFVACQRGNVPHDRNFLSPFTGDEIRGMVSVIDVPSRTVFRTMPAEVVGVEPYGLAVAPNNRYFAVTALRSGTLRLFTTTTLEKKAEVQFLHNLSRIPTPFTIADADANQDFIADEGDPRGFAISADSARIFVTHHKSPYISVVDVALDDAGFPTAASVRAKINTSEYPFDAFFNPTPVQVLASQGAPRFLEDISLSPDGSRALIPHLLHNVNHDVNFDFGPVFAGDFANRVYPALTMIDTEALSFDPGVDHSNRLHHELSDPREPAEYVAFHEARNTRNGILSLGGVGSPVIGGQLSFQVDGIGRGRTAWVWVGSEEVSIDHGAAGIQVCDNRLRLPLNDRGRTSEPIPGNPGLIGRVYCAQAAVFDSATLELQYLSNGLRIVFGREGHGLNKMGYRAGHPSRVLYNQAGTHAVLLNRGSEDIFLYEVSGTDMQLVAVFPPRYDHQERLPLDTTSPMGDLPLGVIMVPDPTTPNDDALIYVQNEITRTLSILRVNFPTNTIFKEHDQIPTHSGPDIFTRSVLIGQELFEDASRAQTSGNFNNACSSCHLDGGTDSNVWQSPEGPRSTMPLYGGTLLTGMILWKGVRLNLGETGPMFISENGGTGVLSDAEQQGLVDYHETIPVPLNPNLNVVGGGLSPLALVGRDLFFGTNDSGTNPTLRRAGCSGCHPEGHPVTLEARGYTLDFVGPELSGGENLERVDPDCVSLQESFLSPNLRNVNSGCDLDEDGDGEPDIDRNGDGWDDRETYVIQNADTDDDFQRDDDNSWSCPVDLGDPTGPRKTFARKGRGFSISTKLGVFSTGPYFHDHSVSSLRNLLDPSGQAGTVLDGGASTNPVYGNARYPKLQKLFNELHDVRGHEDFVPLASKVQLSLQSTDVDADIEALLAFIESL